ncbi:MoaD/ThiS family protein [Candidatus Woesearchaeota archaeon]|nr:MoaD/ThiS family protein [Candidatus Woesearchaeota archaeon]
MRINVSIDREKGKRNVELGIDSSVKDLLNSLRINPVTVIVARNNELIPENEKLNDNDEVRILSVISGG